MLEALKREGLPMSQITLRLRVPRRTLYPPGGFVHATNKGGPMQARSTRYTLRDETSRPPSYSGRADTEAGHVRLRLVREGWRSRDRVRERHDYMWKLYRQTPSLLLKEIALEVFKRFGNWTGKPPDHSTVSYHLKRYCRCEEEGGPLQAEGRKLAADIARRALAGES